MKRSTALAGTVLAITAAIGCSTPARAATGPVVRSIPVLYSYGQDPEWSQVESAGPAPVKNAVLDICAPNGNECGAGPGNEKDSSWVPVISALKKHGVNPLVYVDTLYTRRSIAWVEGQINNAAKFYGTHSVMFDEGGNSCSDIKYYATLYRYVHAHGGGVVINFGTTVPQCPKVGSFMSTADVLTVFEGTQAEFSSATFPSWMHREPASRFNAVVYSGTQAALGNDVRHAQANAIGNLFVTVSGVYSSLPSFWGPETSLLKST